MTAPAKEIRLHQLPTQRGDSSTNILRRIAFGVVSFGVRAIALPVELLCTRYIGYVGLVLIAVTWLTRLRWWHSLLIIVAMAAVRIAHQTQAWSALLIRHWALQMRIIQEQLNARRRIRPSIVLYLRPFAADAALEQLIYPVGGQPDDWADEITGFTEDASPVVLGDSGTPTYLERVVRAMMIPWGYLIGVANPYEAKSSDPRFRVTAQTMEWQEAVQRLAEAARFIVAIVSAKPLTIRSTSYGTPDDQGPDPHALSKDERYEGFTSEIRNLKSSGLLGKLLILVPDLDLAGDKVSLLGERFASLGLTLKPLLREADGPTQIGWFRSDQHGNCTLLHEDADFPNHMSWTPELYVMYVMLVSAILGERLPVVGVLRGMAEYRALCGSPLRIAIEHAERRVKAERKRRAPSLGRLE